MANVWWPVEMVGPKPISAKPTKNAVLTTAAKGTVTVTMNAMATLATS
jgi:hypothetical protein